MIILLSLIFSFMMGCQEKEATAELEAMKVQEQNKALIRKTLEEWNKGNFDFFMETTTPDYVYYYPSGNPNPVSREVTVESTKRFWKSFPDISVSIEEIIAEGDKITTRYVVRGTHEGEFMGIPATGKKIEVSGITIGRIENGKFVEEWEEMDYYGLMIQLGMELKPQSSK